MKIGIDGRLINETGVGRYIGNLFLRLQKIDKKNTYILFQPKIHWHSVKEQLVFPFWLLLQNFDLIHFTYFSFPVFCPKKFIVTIHDLIPWHFKTGKASTLPIPLYQIKHFFYKLVLFLGTRRAEKIIAVSEATKKEIVKHLKVAPDKVVVIYEGVDRNIKYQISNIKNTYKKLKINFPYLLYVGNAYPHKNLERLIEAFAKFKIKNEKLNPPAGGQNLKLILVGPEDYFYHRLKKFVKKRNLQEEVVFYGPAYDKELFFLYRKALAFITSSLMEGFGLPGLEAMALGCPVVCSDIETFREIYQKTALYFDPLDVNDINKKIKQIIKIGRGKREGLIKLGKEQAKKYSWEKCTRATLRVYESCL